MPEPLSDAQIIEVFGGKDAFRDLGYGPEAVRKWLGRGIPWKARIKIQKLADERKVRLPEDFLEERRGPSEAA